jgi:hypothetical protein
MALGYSATLRNNQLDEISTIAGSGARIHICSGTRPATGGTITTILATFTLSGAFAAAASGGVLTVNTPPDTVGLSAAGAGATATWYRIVTSGGTFVMDGSVGVEMSLSSTTISENLPLSVTGHTITAGNA